MGNALQQIFLTLTGAIAGNSEDGRWGEIQKGKQVVEILTRDGTPRTEHTATCDRYFRSALDTHVETAVVSKNRFTSKSTEKLILMHNFSGRRVDFVSIRKRVAVRECHLIQQAFPLQAGRGFGRASQDSTSIGEFTVAAVMATSDSAATCVRSVECTVHFLRMPQFLPSSVPQYSMHVFSVIY